MSGSKHGKLIRILIWIPVILMAILIFGFSGQNGTESGGLSRKTAEIVIQAADQVGILDLNDSNRDLYLDKIEYPIRKCAHMTEYAILGCLFLLAFRIDGFRSGFSSCLAFAATFTYACLDEIHQLFVPGRSGRFTDVLFDSAGCLIGLLLCRLVYKLKCQHHASKIK